MTDDQEWMAQYRRNMEEARAQLLETGEYTIKIEGHDIAVIRLDEEGIFTEYVDR